MTRAIRKMETLKMAMEDFDKDVAEYRNNSHEYDYTWWMYEYLSFSWDSNWEDFVERQGLNRFFDFLENLTLD